MLFNSLTFVAFFAIVLALHNAPLPWTAKKANLLIASYLFYAAWNPPFVILLWLSTIVDWHVAKRLFTEEIRSRRRILLAVSVIVNLGLLGYFKYGQFLLENFISLAALAGVSYEPPEWNIILPVGISFYTFQTMAYSLDVYLRRAEPSKSFLDFALFVTFFPQLVAGPIVRPTHLLPQFAVPRVATSQQLYWGLALMTIGLFQKIVIADGLLAPAADAVFGASETLYPLDAWLGTLAFSGQIFSDFAGYSTTAIGVALTLGFGLPDNFRFPYAAIGFSDFWRRWHISLSSWLRDYLYIPLGGNRKGNLRTYANLMTTMLLGGLWHGASWTFVVWGGLHGLYLAVERWLKARVGNLGLWTTLPMQVLLALVTYFLINITWVFFRAPDFPTSWRLIDTMLTFEMAGDKVLSTALIAQTVVTIGAMLAVHWYMRERRLDAVVGRLPGWLNGIIWGAMLMLIVITQGGAMPSSTSSSDASMRASRYDRALPQRPLGRSLLVAGVVAFALLAAWEMHWRSFGATPTYRNSAGLWAIERRRIDNGEGDATVIIGSSRQFFNTQLDVWERVSGERPIQLGLEGTSPLSIMENLADDPDFTGTLIVGVAPGLFFGGFEMRKEALERYLNESPSQWLGQRISMLFEPFLASYHFDYALFTVIKRQPWPERQGVFVEMDVRRLITLGRDRSARLWSKVETDPEYQALAKKIWADGFIPIEERDEEWIAEALDNRRRQIERAVAATKKLREKGVQVIFVRNPSEGHYEISDPMYNPRAETWDVLIEASGALGLHWKDHEELQGYWLPEWSHIAGDDADRYTEALYYLIQEELAARAVESTDEAPQ